MRELSIRTRGSRKVSIKRRLWRCDECGQLKTFNSLIEGISTCYDCALKPRSLVEDHLKLMREHAELLDLYERHTQTTQTIGKAFSYYGGKSDSDMTRWIISHFPPRVTYVEPFAGALGVFLSMPRSQVEVVSDLNGQIVNFFKVLRDCPDDLIRAIALTPYAKTEYASAFLSDEGVDNVERARRFFVRVELGWTGTGEQNMGFHRQKGAQRKTSFARDFKNVFSLYAIAQRLKDAQIEEADAFAQIERYDSKDTLFYLDPPYLAETRGSDNRAYRHEMAEDDHRRLAETLHRIKGMAVLSGYPSDLYTELYADWQCVTRQTRDVTQATRTEHLWLSPTVASKRQAQLFSL